MILSNAKKILIEPEATCKTLTRKKSYSPKTTLRNQKKVNLLIIVKTLQVITVSQSSRLHKQLLSLLLKTYTSLGTTFLAGKQMSWAGKLQ